METPTETLSASARAYFLVQGQSISRLHHILHSNVFYHHLRRWTALVLELGLWLMFAAALVLAAFIPTKLCWELVFQDNSSLAVTYDHPQLRLVAYALSGVVVCLSFPCVGLAIVIGRNRRKRILIREAFDETGKMKAAFDEAVRNLRL